MNIIIIKIVFEQLPNFPFLRCVNRLPIGVDDLVNIGLNFFLPIRFFCLDWYSWLWAVKAAIFFAQKFWSRTEMWGLGALVWIFISPRLSGSTAALHYDASPIEKWEIKELAKMTTSPPIFGRYELFQIKYLDTTFGQFHFLAYIWSGLIIQRRQTFLIALFSWSSSRLAEGCEKVRGPVEQTLK